MRTLLDRDTSSRPKRRFGRYQIDIAALSATRFAEEDSVEEANGEYTFLWRGKAKDGDRIHGAGLAIKTLLCRQVPDLPTSVSKRLMKLRFSLNPSRYVTVMSAYTPTLTSSNEAKDAFYEELHALMKGAPATPPPPPPPSDYLILLGDFSATVSTECNNWKGVLGLHGTGKLNSNGLTITITPFRQADRSKQLPGMEIFRRECVAVSGSSSLQLL